VILALDEMVRVKLVDVVANKNQAPLSMWIEKESGKVAKAGTYTANEKM
jgi:hypothetical protein